MNGKMKMKKKRKPKRFLNQIVIKEEQMNG